MQRRHLLQTLGASVLAPVVPHAFAQGTPMPGITASEIRMGTTTPLSGPAAGFSSTTKALAAWFEARSSRWMAAMPAA